MKPLAVSLTGISKRSNTSVSYFHFWHNQSGQLSRHDQIWQVPRTLAKLHKEKMEGSRPGFVRGHQPSERVACGKRRPGQSGVGFAQCRAWRSPSAGGSRRRGGFPSRILLSVRRHVDAELQEAPSEVAAHALEPTSQGSSRRQKPP